MIQYREYVVTIFFPRPRHNLRGKSYGNKVKYQSLQYTQYVLVVYNSDVKVTTELGATEHIANQPDQRK